MAVISDRTLLEEALEKARTKINEEFQVYDIRESKTIVQGKMITLEYGINNVFMYLENGYRVCLTTALLKKLLSQEVMDRLTGNEKS